MNLCIDLVVNHTAREHAWAQGWLAGDPAYAGFYTAFPDRQMPDAYDATIPEVFPDRAPGSFTWVPEACGGAGGWVWTTFWPYQWDLDYTNPAVTLAMLGEITWLANRGVDVFRMDAVPFMWKRLGTTCQNQPEGHTLLQLLHALTRLAAPGVVFKAEAIVSPEDLVPYLGGHERYRPECELAYHNQLMVMLWSSLATQDARLATRALARLPQIPPSTSWVTYVRGHDDIGWAVSDTDAGAAGVSGARPPAVPQRLLQRPVPGLLRARGAVPGERGDRRRADLRLRRLALRDRGRRSSGGTRWRWSAGSAVSCCSTPSSTPSAGSRCSTWATSWPCATTPATSTTRERAPDNRWMHRPPMDWTAAARRWDPTSLEGRVFARAAAARRRPGARCRCCGAAASARCSTPATPPSWRGDGATRAAGPSSGWPT